MQALLAKIMLVDLRSNWWTWLVMVFIVMVEHLRSCRTWKISYFKLSICNGYYASTSLIERQSTQEPLLLLL